MSGAFFVWCLFIFIAVYFYCYFCFSVSLLVFNNKNNSFFDVRYVSLVIKATRNADGLFQCSLAENGTMFILSYFYT